MAAGKSKPKDTMTALGKHSAELLKMFDSLGKMKVPARLWILRRAAGRKQRFAADIAVAAYDYVFSLESSAHFRTFSPRAVHLSLTNTEKTADRLEKEIKSLIEQYRKSGRHPDLDGPPKEPSPNSKYVFIVLVDALRADHLGCYGYKRPTSPFIDRLASEGMLFENAFSQASITHLSVASLFTAMYPTALDMLRTDDWPYQSSLIDRFRKAGWATGAFSAAGFLFPESHFDYGFDRFEYLKFNRAGVIIGEMTRWLERARTKSDRTFVYIHLMETHDDYTAPPPFFDMFDPGYRRRVVITDLKKVLESQETECPFDLHTDNWDRPDPVIDCIRKSKELPPDFSMRDVENIVARYDGEIRYADSQIERFFDYLENEKILDRSLVVLLADHGESFFEHNTVQHSRVLYDNELHVPLIFWRGGKNFGGMRVARQVELIDVFPTVLGLLGISIPKSLHGENLLSGKKGGNDRAYSITPLHNCKGKQCVSMAMREPPYKLIYEPGNGNSELYNLSADPKELKNVCAAERDVCDRMKKGLLWWYDKTSKTRRNPAGGIFDEKQRKRLKDLGYIND